MNDLPAEVEEVRVLRLQPGDIIVARVHDRVTAQQAQTTVERLKEFFKDHEVLVCSGLTLEVAPRPPKKNASDEDHAYWQKITREADQRNARSGTMAE